MNDETLKNKAEEPEDVSFNELTKNSDGKRDWYMMSMFAAYAFWGLMIVGGLVLFVIDF